MKNIQIVKFTKILNNNKQVKNWLFLRIWHFLRRAQKCKIVFFSNLGIVRNVKPTDVSWYSIPGKAYGLRHVDSNTRKYLVMVLRVIKDISKFHDFNNIIFQKYEPKQQLNFQFLENRRDIFSQVDNLIFNHLIIWRKKYLFLLQLTRRYGPLRGPTSSSCGRLRPSTKAFFALWAKKRAYYAFLAIFGIFR